MSIKFYVSYLTANPVSLFRIICVGIVAFGVLGTLVYVGARHMKATADERDPFGSSAGKKEEGKQ